MEPHELNRMFDQLSPTPEQEEAVLDRLLQPERKGSPMKKIKKLTAVALAATLMVCAAAAAVATGIDQRLAEYFGAGPEQVQLLAPGTLTVDITAEDNGAILQVSQILMDRYSVLMLADFTAPEGTVLNMGEDSKGSYIGFGGSGTCFLDKDGAPIDAAQSWSWSMDILDDGDSLDNHLTLLITANLSSGIQPDWNAAAFHMSAVNLLRFDRDERTMVPVYSGDWSCDVPLPQKEIGWSQSPNCVVGQLDGAEITLKEVYLSPMTLQVILERETAVNTENMSAEDEAIYGRWLSAVNIQRIALTTKDGQSISLEGGDGAIGDQEQWRTFQLTELTDPALFQGGTLSLRIGEQICTVPLDGLEPAAD